MHFLRSIITIAALGVALTRGAFSAEPAFSITISMPGSVVAVGSEIRLDIITKNISSNSGYRVEGTGPGRSIHVEVLRSNGARVSETPRGQTLHGTDPHRHSGGSIFSTRIPIKPGETFEEHLLLNEEYDLSQPGKYTVQVYRSNFITEDSLNSKSDAPIITKSNTITLTLTP